MTFNTYHWYGCSLGDSQLERYRTELATESQDETAFLALLRSGHRAAVCMALEYYHYADVTSRYTGGNSFSSHAAEVRERARELLENPPSPRSETGAEKDGADHASALLALLNLAQPEDADLIASSLRQSTTAYVREAAVMAANAALTRTTGRLHEGLVTVLSDIIFNDSVASDDRVDAVKAFNGVNSPEAADIAARALGVDDHDVQVHAAIILSTRHLATHRAAVEQLVATWPEDVPYPAAAVLDALQTEREGKEQ